MRSPPIRARRPAAGSLLAAAALLAVPAVAASATPGRTLFLGNWETGDTSQWGGCQTRHRSGIAIVSAPRREGRRVARFEVTDGDFDGYGDRSECQATTREAEGRTRWYTWSTYIPASLPPQNARSWAVITQWHCTCSGSPPVGFYLQEDRLELSLHRRDRADDDDQIELVPWGRPISQVRGRWTDFRVRIHWSAHDSRGTVALWINGRRQRMNWPHGDDRARRYGGVGATLVRARTLVPGESGAYLKQGLYRSGSIDGRAVIYHDGMRMTGGR